MTTTHQAAPQHQVQPSRFFFLHSYRAQLRRAGLLKSLSQSAAIVLLALADYADTEGYCWPSVARIVAENPIKERAARAALGELERRGLLVREQRLGRTTRYRLVVHGMPTTPAPDAPPTPAPDAPRTNHGLRTQHGNSEQVANEEATPSSNEPVAVSQNRSKFPAASATVDDDKKTEARDSHSPKPERKALRAADEAQTAASKVSHLPEQRLPLELYQELQALGVRRAHQLAHHGERRVHDVLLMLKSAQAKGKVGNPAAWVVTALREGWEPTATPRANTEADHLAEQLKRREEAEQLRREAQDPEKVRRGHLARLAARCLPTLPARMRKQPEDMADHLAELGLSVAELVAYLAEQGES